MGSPEDEPADRDVPVDHDVVDPHGATDPITPSEYVGRRHGVQGVWDSVAYWTQFVLLSAYGPASQSEFSDPVQRLRRKYGRPSQRS
jgi:hypothetical protein